MPTPTSSIHRSAVPEETISAEQFARMEDRLDALLEEIKGLRRTTPNSRNALTLKMKKSIDSPVNQPNLLSTVSPITLSPLIDNTADGMDTEKGGPGITLVNQTCGLQTRPYQDSRCRNPCRYEEAGMTSPPLSSYGIRRPPPKTFSENFDVNQPRQHSGPMSFATAVRQIAKGNATPDHAARVVFRSTYPRSNVEGITNIYMKGYVQPGPKRFVTVRNALFTLGITLVFSR
ncbi:hypothetical protein BC829DRAFT_416968 [Chytridium lagenaria]|nr:hypothetical protein BC829DRAFT_416968 [Chytridium lagenaria]